MSFRIINLNKPYLPNRNNINFFYIVAVKVGMSGLNGGLQRIYHTPT